MKKLAYLGGAAGIGLAATLALVGVSHESQAADHRDADNLKKEVMATNHPADINDVYAWTTSDASKVNLVMTVAPFAAAGDGFSTSVLYVFHVNAQALGQAPDPETRIICKFASQTSVQCWLGASAEYVSGDPSATAGITSADGKMRVFAGLRDDPFFFNLDGFAHVVGQVEGATLPTDDGKGCYNLGALGPVLAGNLAKNLAGDAAGTDKFAGANVQAIVIQVDKSLLVATGKPILSVWASTNTPGT